MNTSNKITKKWKPVTTKEIESLLDEFWFPYYGSNEIKDGTHEVAVAGYAKDEVTVEQEGNFVFVEAENKKRGKRTHKFIISDYQQIDEVTYNNGLLEFVIGKVKEKSRKIKIN